MPIDSKFGSDDDIVQQVIQTSTPTAVGNAGEIQWNFNDIMAADTKLHWDAAASKLTVTGDVTTTGTTELSAVAMKGHILPDTDNVYDIGSAEYKIRDMYVSEGSLWVGDQTGVGSSGGKVKFKNRKTTAPIRIETITSGAQRTFTAKLSSADAVNAQRFHDEFDGQMAGVTYEIENLAKTEKATFAVVSYTAEDTTTPGGPFAAYAVLDPETTAGETIFAAHSAGDQYNIFMNMNAVATSGPNGNLELGSKSKITFGLDNRMGVDSSGKTHSSTTKSSTSNTAGGIPIHNVSAGTGVGQTRVFEAEHSTENNQAFQDFNSEMENGNVPVDTKYDIENEAGTEGGEFLIKSFVAESGADEAYVVMEANDQEAVNAFSNHSDGDRYKFFKEEKLVVTGRADGKLPLQFIQGPGGATNFEDLFDPSTGRLHINKIEVPAEEGQVLKGGPSGGLQWGKHHGDGSIPLDNNKTPSSPGTPGELAIGQTAGQWFFYVCVMPNQWTRAPLTLGW
jgi:hypothetical protein